MTETPLAIRPTRTAQHEAHAWYLPRCDADAVLGAVAALAQAMGRHTEGFRLLLAPATRDVLDARGLLLFHEDGPLEDLPATLTQAGRTQRWEAYGLVAGRLFLPTHAKLFPPVTDDELATLLVHRWSLFQPVVGFVGYGEREALRPLDLLARPMLADEAWDAAIAGPRLNDRLRSLRPLDPPGIEDVIEQGKGDIGSEREQPLPPTEDEPSQSALAKFGRKLKGKGAKGLYRAMGGASAPGLTRGIAQWAAGIASAMSRADSALRNKEVNRLLDMLRRNPLEGLRHAIPMGGEAPRGIAPPTNRLGTQAPNFNLGGLSSGGAADYWELDWEQQQALMTRYRELAIEEAQRGNHRRAAYIYANLLNDMHNAAEVLARGGYHREAAVLYRDKLNQPQRAAGCLLEGGLLVEAADLYEQLGDWQHAAGVYERLEDKANAERCYLTAVEQLKAKNDHLGAAKLLEDKLHNVEAAVLTLQEGWRGRAQRKLCLAGLYALLNRRGMHDKAKQFTRESLDERLDDDLATLFAPSLAQASIQCADNELAAWMADELRVFVAGRLQTRQHAPQTARKALVEAVAELAPNDNLLRRDGRRYVAQHQPQARPIPLKEPGTIELVNSWQLPAGVSWYDVLIAGGSYVAFGHDGKKHHLVRGVPAGEPFTHVIPELHTSLVSEDRFISIGLTPDHDVPIPTRLGSLKESISFPATYRLQPLTLAPLGWQHQDMAAFARGPGDGIATFDLNALAVNVYRGSHDLIATHTMPQDAEAVQRVFESWVWDKTDPSDVGLHFARDAIYLCLGGDVLRIRDSDWAVLYESMSPLRQLVGVHPLSRCRFALVHDRGATLVRDNLSRVTTQRVGQDIEEPKAAFTMRSGHLVLANDHEMAVYDTSRDGAGVGAEQVSRLIARRDMKQQDLVAVTPWRDSDAFFTLCRDGSMRMFTA